MVIDEIPIDDIPSPSTFWDEYVSKEKAAILRGAATHSPGFKLWTEDYMSEAYGDLEIRLEGKNERNSEVPVGEKGLGRDTLRNFLETFRGKDTYIVSQLPEPMYKDFYIPPCISCGNMRNRIVEIDLWMSSGNTHSIVHKDAFNAINCLMKGTKYWKLIEYKYEKWLYKTWEPQREVGGNSQVDPQSIDLIRFPDVGKIRWSNITINAGDCLFLPKSYYHQVSSYGDPNMAVSVLFSRIPHFDDAGCDNTPIGFTPLSEVDVLWSWPGHGEMTMGNLDVWMLQSNYARFAEKHGNITAGDLARDLSATFVEMEDEKVKQFADQSWKVLDKAGKGFLTADELRALDTQTLRDHVLAVTTNDPSNTDKFEYSYIDAAVIEELLDALINNLPEGIKRDMFVTQYVRHVGGSEEYANEIFDGLAGQYSDEVTAEQIEANKEEALRKWKEHAQVEPTPEIDKRYDLNNIHLFRDEL